MAAFVEPFIINVVQNTLPDGFNSFRIKIVFSVSFDFGRLLGFSGEVENKEK